MARHLNSTPDIPAYYDSQAAAAAGLGIPVALLKRLKADGCDAFRSNRVDVRKLIAWLCKPSGERPEVDLDTANTWVALERREILRMEKEEKMGLLMSQGDAMAVVNSWGVPIRQKLIALEAELKHRCNPIDPELAGAALKEWVCQCMRLLQAEIPRVSRETNEANGEKHGESSGSIWVSLG